MKKSIILSAFVLGAFTANAQSVVEGTKFADNWSVGVNAGAITPLTHSAFFKSMPYTWTRTENFIMEQRPIWEMAP